MSESQEAPPPRRLFFVAGEPSGDNHAARVIRELREQAPGIALRGLGGPRMREAGAEILVDLASQAVMGIFPVLAHLGTIRGWFRTAQESIEAERPDALVLVDYPGFNLRLADWAKARGLRVIYYIGPQVWAWNRRRLRRIARSVDHMIVILPFEAEFYRQAGIPVTYVGHPIRDHVDEAAVDPAVLAALRSGIGRPLVGLFPGSRSHVVRSLAPILLAACEHFRRSPAGKEARFVVAAASAPLAAIVAEAARGRDLPLEIVTGQSAAVMQAMDLALTTSGTTTLEIAAQEKPMLLAYRVSALLYWLGRRLIRVPHIGLVNLVAGRGIVPEFIDCRDFHERLGRELVDLWADADRRRTMVADLRAVNESLDAEGSYRRTAACILSEIASVDGRAGG